MVNEVKDTPYYLYSLFSYRETRNKVHFIHSIHQEADYGQYLGGVKTYPPDSY